MAKYQKYAEYQDSGIEWLGEIPNSWQVKKLKYLCKVTTGNKDTVNAVEDGKYPFFVRSQTVERINSIGADCEAVLTAGDGVGVGKVYHYYKGKFDFHQRVYMLYDFGDVIGRFVYYYLSSNFYKVALEGNAKSTVDSLRLPQFLNFAFSLPTIKEQDWIVDFLDHETAKIDTLIAKQEKLIELLKEKRQAVISHAVTKGLNPNVPMKNSGVEWLGEVPEHWVIPRLKQLIKYGSSISYGIVQPGDALDEGIPFIQTTNISKGSFELQDFQKTSVAIESNYPRSRLEGGEVILGIRASIGAAFVVPMSFKGVNLSRGIARIIPNALLKSDFLVWYFKSNAVDQYWGLSKQGSTFSEVSIETVRELSVVVPPIDEQEKISEFLSFELGKLERLISSAENQKLLLLERRTALISAAVTGKIDIRNWQAPSVIEADTELSA
ncbi:restriction endonuclease subunit S [Acinetobacter baumannii]|uniref:restriction endonuclease subunit S n=1 Tax=Acinetobacter baumannii TaxID=470 RepID=UPI0022B32958|nr:restriction endonuclease subunit S [Acinetobacter baumannii]